MKPLVGRVLAVLVGLATGALVVEVGIRALGFDRPVLDLAIVGSTTPTSAYHPRRGWMNLPNSGGWLSWPGTDRTFHLTTNAQGFRFPRDYRKDKSRPARLALVGDSQVFGFVVKDDETLGVLLDRDMRDVETYPFGVPGYGPTQEMLMLEDTVLEYRPDVVVAVLFLQNDLNDETENVAYGFLPKPFLRRSQGDVWEVANVPVPLPLTPSPPSARLFLRPRALPFALSAAYRLAAYRSMATPTLASTLDRLGLGSLETIAVREDPGRPPDTGFRRMDGVEPACNIVWLCPEEHWLDGLPPAVAAYERMARLCATHGIHFMTLVAPAPKEFVLRRFPITTAMTSALEAKGIEVVSLEEPFMRVGDPMTMIAPDQHWNAEGTKLAAAIVREKVLTRLEGRRPTGSDPGR